MALTNMVTDYFEKPHVKPFSDTRASGVTKHLRWSPPAAPVVHLLVDTTYQEQEIIILL